MFTTGDATTDNGAWLVRVDRRGGRNRAGWDTAVTQCYNKASDCPTGQLAIELDGVIESYPVINDPSYTDSVQITGTFTQGEAESLARVLNSGSLPVQLEVLSTQNVSPTLGKASLKAARLSPLVRVLDYLVGPHRHPAHERRDCGQEHDDDDRDASAASAATLGVSVGRRVDAACHFAHRCTSMVEVSWSSPFGRKR